MNFSLRHIPAAIATMVLAACGGGNSGVPAATPPAATPTIGVAVDGYLKAATATCDTNGDGVASAGEVSVTTTAVGKYTCPNGCNAVVIVTGGIDIDTLAEFKGGIEGASRFDGSHATDYAAGGRHDPGASQVFAGSG